MANTAAFVMNSPVSGATYYARMGYGCIPTSGTTVIGNVQAWSGANGTGSLVAVTSLTAIARNNTLGSDFSFTAGGANTATVNHTATNSTDWYKAAASYTGGAIGSLVFYLSFSGTPFVPSITSFSPTVGPAGTSVSVVGSHLTESDSRDFNGVDVGASYTFVDDSHITIVVPAGATTGPIHVVSGNGTATSSTNYQVGIIYGSHTAGAPVVLQGIYGSHTAGAPVAIQGVYRGPAGGGTPIRIW